MFSKVLYEAVKETLVEYLNKTSLNGCYLLYSIRRRKYQRLVWSIFIAVTVAFAAYVCWTVLTAFLRDPIVTTLDTQPYTIYEAPFPAIAVCSHNKFSRQALRNFASNIQTNQTLTYWMKRLEMLTALYNYDSTDFEKAGELQIELENILGEKLITSKIIKLLSPSCDDLLVKCFWAGELINCKKQFEFKMFLDGPCCVFNYQYKKDLDSLYYPMDTGSYKGLALLLNASTNDYFYAENSAVGFNIKIFSTQIIPDVKIGHTGELYVGAGENVNVELEMVSQVTQEDARVYSVHKRLCYFPREQDQATFDISECILKCHVYAIRRSCQCIPFYVVNSDIEKKSTVAITDECSLFNLGCLASYKFELFDSSECVGCYPSCSYNHYWYRKTVNRLTKSRIFRNCKHKRYLCGTTITPDLSLVKIYYPSEMATKYNRDVLYNWTHILSYIGGVISICMGCSFISGIEMIYFVCYRFVEKCLKLRRTQIQIHN